MTNLRENFYAVEVPEDGLNFIIHKPFNKYWHINCDYPPTHKYTNWGRCIFYKEFGGKNKYPGALQIVCTSKEVKEAEAKLIVECTQPKVRGAKVQMAFYKNYDDEHSSYASDRVSLHSLLASKGLTGKNYLIIQNV